MIVTFSMSCVLEKDASAKDQQKVTDYVMSGNINPQMASQLLQQLMILEAVKRAKLEEEAKKAAEMRRQEALKDADRVLKKEEAKQL